jgi:GT2 family glycosyltransferase
MGNGLIFAIQFRHSSVIPGRVRMTAPRNPAAQVAFNRGEAAERAGDLLGAERAYDLAQRHAPSDRGITMAVGRVRLARGEARASEAFELVARLDDSRDAWICLASTRRRFGRNDMAAEELHQALSRHAPPRFDAFALLCEEILVATGRPGWIGLGNDGILLVNLHFARSARGLAVTLDGAPLATPRSGRELRIRLPKDWRSAHAISVTHGTENLLGSPISVAAITRCEGFAAAEDGGIQGWAWLPGDPDTDPELTLRSQDGLSMLRVTADAPVRVAHAGHAARIRSFRVPAERLAGWSGPIDIIGPNGKPLTGCPVDPHMEQRSARSACDAVRRLFPADGPRRKLPAGNPEVPAVPADLVGPPPDATPDPRRPVDVVIPVYRGVAETLACIESARAGLPRWARIVVVEDCSPEPEMVAALDRLAAQTKIVLHRLKRNRGFPGAANEGIRQAAGRDVVLLNSDTLCPPGWLARLRQAAHSAPDIGSVTPLSNDATIMSYPTPGDGNAVPDLAQVKHIDHCAHQATGDTLVDLPSAIGFCMYIRRDCLADVGALREDVFAQGYGEENDFCLRARHLGWRNVGLPGLFIGHIGGRSFGTAKAHLITRNLRVMERLHPGYAALVQDWCAVDPMAEHRRAIDLVRWRADSRPGAVVLLRHNRNGGVTRRVEERCRQLREAGSRAVVLTPEQKDGLHFCLVSDAVDNAYPNLRFDLPRELDALLALLRAEQPALVEIHHFIAHHPSLLDLPEKLGVPSEVVLHDYAWLCPRINLVGAAKRYCGEPDLEECEACVRDLGTTIDEEISPKTLIARSDKLLGAARRIIAPSSDTARRYRRHLPRVRAEVQPWENDASLPPPVIPVAQQHLRVAVVGGIGIEKGYEVLLGCAREAARRRRPMSFVVIGHTCDDMRLLEVGNVTITGPYLEGQAEALIRAENAALGFLPSLWPETWCYALSETWRAGLHVLAFDIGAPAERIRSTGRGWLLPLAAGPGNVNDALMAAFRTRTMVHGNAA